MGLLDQATSAVTGTFDSLVAGLPFIGAGKVPPPQLMKPDFTGGFFIDEYLQGTQLNADTALVLNGTMMPMQPFPWEVEQRLVAEYYPGNPEPSVQVLGPKEGPLTITGRFK